MKVALDLTSLLPDRTGVDTYLVGLVHALARTDPETEYTVFVNAEDRSTLSLPPNFRVVTAARRPRLARLAFQQAALPVATLRQSFDVVHSPAFIMPVWRGGARHVLTVHDVTSFTRPEVHTPLRRSRPYLAAVRSSIRRADRIIVPSAYVRTELEGLFRRPADGGVLVIPHGIDERFTPHAHGLVDTGLPKPYVLFVGTLEPRKNLLRLIEAYARTADTGREEHLVLAGKTGWYGSELSRALAAPSLRGRVHVIGHVDDAVLPTVYAEARAFVYPSLEEGFGFPPLEAMASGVPTVVSDSSALAEHVGDAAVRVDPADTAGLGHALLRVVEDERLRGELRAAGLARAAEFSWDVAAEATRRCYRELAGARASGSRDRVFAAR